MRNFGLSLSISLAILGVVVGYMGLGSVAVVIVLASIELALSFDNAVINARLLSRLNPLWRFLFLSVGIIVAVFGIRMLLPLLIVSISAHLSIGDVTSLALRHPDIYSRKLTDAYPSVTAFGGAFLMMVSLRFFMAKRDVHWIKAIEQLLSRFVKYRLSLLMMIIVILVLAALPFNHHSRATLWSGLAGLLVYVIVQGIMSLIDNMLGDHTSAKQLGWTAFATFLYLELLDASMSFDNVIAAFAITNKVLLIAAGLGIGAIWVRSLTVYMVRRRTLDAYKYLEHGAQYAITVLALAMLLSMVIEVPDPLIGFLCLILITASVISSRRALLKNCND